MDVTQTMREWLRMHNCDLAGLLLRHGLISGKSAGETGVPVRTLPAPSASEVLPWLVEAIESSPAWAYSEGAGGGSCAGVVSVDEWFVGA